MNDDVIAWIESLTARGVSVKVDGRRLAYRPKGGYSTLTADERAYVKVNKATIIAALHARYNGVAYAAVATPPSEPNDAPTPADSAPEPCRWCYRAPCIGPEHPAFFALHPYEAQRQADEYATQEMLAQVGKPRP